MYFLEGGPLLCVPPPAAQHDLIERVRTQHRLRQVDLHERERELKPAIHPFVFVDEMFVTTLTCLFWSLKNSPVFSITCSSVS